MKTSTNRCQHFLSSMMTSCFLSKPLITNSFKISSICIFWLSWLSLVDLNRLSTFRLILPNKYHQSYLPYYPWIPYPRSEPWCLLRSGWHNPGRWPCWSRSPEAGCWFPGSSPGSPGSHDRLHEGSRAVPSGCILSAIGLITFYYFYIFILWAVLGGSILFFEIVVFLVFVIVTLLGLNLFNQLLYIFFIELALSILFNILLSKLFLV